MYSASPTPQPMPKPTPTPPTPSFPENLRLLIPQITFSYLYTLSDLQIANEMPTSQTLNYAALLAILDNKRAKCVNLGSHVFVCRNFLTEHHSDNYFFLLH